MFSFDEGLYCSESFCSELWSAKKPFTHKRAENTARIRHTEAAIFRHSHAKETRERLVCDVTNAAATDPVLSFSAVLCNSGPVSLVYNNIEVKWNRCTENILKDGKMS